MIAATTSTPNHRSLPRQKRPPSQRDQAIYLAYRTQGLTQQKLATDHRVSQRRISQIIHRVHFWLANASTCNLEPETCNLLDHDQLQRLERHLERERAQAIYDRAIRAHDQGIQSLKSTRQGKRGNTPFEETVLREVLPSPQHLKTAIQASRDRARVADKPAPPPPPKPDDDEQALWKQTLTALYQARQQAEDEKKVIRGDGHLDYLSTVEQWLDALLGNRPEYFHPDDIAPGTPLHELATFYYGRPRATNSVPGSSLGPQDPEAPASPAPAYGDDPQTDPSNPSNPSNLTSSTNPPFDSELESYSPLPPTPTPRSSPPLSTEYSVPSTPPFRVPRSSLNPEPRTLNPLPYHIDDYGYQPTTQSKEEQTQMLKDYCEKLRAEHLANSS